jgi:transcriptional regulator with XRE-family HTH domain
VVRTARIRRGWRQSDLARIVGVSDGTISRVERGHLSSVSLGALRRIAQALDVRVELLPRSRSAHVDRLANARHAELAEASIKWLLGFGGWIARPEVSFSCYGERGVIDLLAWHPGRRTLLVIELKTLIVDVGELLGTLDRKARNALEIARGLGWNPVSVSTLLVVADSSTNRRRVDARAATFAASLPERVVALRRWLRDPIGRVHGLQFFSVRHQGQVIQRFHHRQRVTLASADRGRRHSSVAELAESSETRPDVLPTVLRDDRRRQRAI